jgi:hypothetical protein
VRASPLQRLATVHLVAQEICQRREEEGEKAALPAVDALDVALFQ